MTILWGDTFPIFHFLQGYNQQDVKDGDASNKAFDITLANISATNALERSNQFAFNTIKVTYTDTSATDRVEIFTDDGAGNLASDLGGSGTIDYETGAVHLVLAYTPEAGTGNVVIDSHYYRQQYTVQLNAPDLFEVNITWARVKDYKLLTFANTIKTGIKHRGEFVLFAESVEDINTLDWLRIAQSWHSEQDDRLLVLYPRPNYLGGFIVVPQSNFKVTHPIQGKWIAQRVQLVFVTVNVFDSIPEHTGGVSDAK